MSEQIQKPPRRKPWRGPGKIIAKAKSIETEWIRGSNRRKLKDVKCSGCGGELVDSGRMFGRGSLYVCERHCETCDNVCHRPYWVTHAGGGELVKQFDESDLRRKGGYCPECGGFMTLVDAEDRKAGGHFTYDCLDCGARNLDTMLH